jgi:hypothetical protein
METLSIMRTVGAPSQGHRELYNAHLWVSASSSSMRILD